MRVDKIQIQRFSLRPSTGKPDPAQLRPAGSEITNDALDNLVAA
jgi:hypothetical protein